MRIHSRFASIRAAVVLSCTFVSIVSVALAYESSVVYVDASLRAPLVLSATEVSLSAADSADAHPVRISLSSGFEAQDRVETLEYRLVTVVEPPAGIDSSGSVPAVVCARDTDEPDTRADGVDSATLTGTTDPSDVWLISLQSAPAVSATAPSPSAGETSASVVATATPDATSPPTAKTIDTTLPASGVYRVSISVEIVRYTMANGKE